MQLAALGVPRVLKKILQEPKLKRQCFERAIYHISMTCVPILEHGDEVVSLTHNWLTTF